MALEHATIELRPNHKCQPARTRVGLLDKHNLQMQQYLRFHQRSFYYQHEESEKCMMSVMEVHTLRFTTSRQPCLHLDNLSLFPSFPSFLKLEDASFSSLLISLIDASKDRAAHTNCRYPSPRLEKKVTDNWFIGSVSRYVERDKHRRACSADTDMTRKFQSNLLHQDP